MRDSKTLRLVAIAASVALAACDDDDDNGANRDGSVFDTAALDVQATAPMAANLDIGSGMVFTTAALEVAAGAVITVRNNDTVSHTVTSQSAPNTFTPSGAFDTGEIAPGGTATINIPSNSTGTAFHFYCTLHSWAMQPPNGTIIVK